ncbi:HYR domain-containing protein [Solirubrobacter deserti]|uniref:HYR domain-containing protein n=1 Tax=Solirubrobacter deserti TaxID=2282478 RepID=A0ABT4RJR8_9ACTN|nr:HYR domain-containing protein [Solirubrobacter deserti]MDA0138789.1 HYR domain-containing protein [Solirubrobacter deserti]
MWDDQFALASDIRDVVEWADSCLNWANIPKKIFCQYRSERLINDFDEAINQERRVSPLNLVDDDLHDRLVSAYERLLGRAPKAHVYVMPYPKIVDGADVDGDCELLGPGEPSLTRGDRRAIDSVITMLNAEVHKAVKATGSSRISYVELGTDFDQIPLCKNGRINPQTGFNSATNPFFSTPGNYGPISYAFHPNARGQEAYASALKRALNERIAPQRVLLDLGQTIDVGTLQPAAGADTLQAQATWPGSTVSLSFVSPGGTVVDEDSPGVVSMRTPTSHKLVLANPGPGTWKLRVTGDDVHEDEPVDVEAFTTTPDRAPPSVAARAERVDGTASTFRLIADGPADATHTWAFSDGGVATGARVEHRFTNAGELWATLKTAAADGQTTWTPLTVRGADASAPVIATAADVVAEAASGAGRAVEFTPPSATDGVGAPIGTTCAPASGSVFALGATEVTCSATAGGKRVTSRFTVRVQDTTPPVFGPAPDVRTGAFAVPVATDTVDGAVDVGCSPASGAVFAVGATPVTCSAADRAGNAASVRFVVTIDPVVAPAPRHADPKPVAAGRTALKRAIVRGQTVTAQLACPAGTSGCAAVTARLMVKRSVVGTGRTGALASGKTAKLTVKLNAKGRALLKRGRVKATLELRQGTTVLGKRAVTLRR